MMIDSKLLFCAAALCAAVSLNAEAKLYKWVDENGTTHYGEVIPPEYANREAKKLEKGRVTERKDTFESAKQKTTKTEAVEDKATVEARRRDEALMASYSNEQEIDLARDRALTQVDARINSYTVLLKSAQATLDDLHKESDSFTQKGRKIPASLTEDIANAEARVVKLQKDLDTSQKDAEAVKARYEADKQRYRQLKGQSGGAQQ
jgi:hypothetical protein